MNVDRFERILRVQRRAGVAIVLWSLLPFAAALECISTGDLGRSAIFLAVTGIGFTAAGLVRLPYVQSQVIAALLLILMWGPSAGHVWWLLVVGCGTGALRVADSPAGYVMAVVLDSLFAVPLAVLTVGTFQRARKQQSARSTAATTRGGDA